MKIGALYEVKRQGFLIGYVQDPDKYDNALAFAYENWLAPIFHEEIMRETHGEDPFEEAYAVSADFMKEVTKFLDECWLAKNFDEVEFCKLEDKFGGYNTNRIELIRAIEYARISGRFDDELLGAIEQNAPVEANSIASTFESDEVYFG